MTQRSYPTYKDSGLPWLGSIPAHWKIARLKHVAMIQTGIAKGKDYTGIDTVNVPYLRVANVQDGYFNLEDVATIEVPVSDVERYRLRPGDVLMNEGGDNDKLGRGHIWTGEVDPCVHQNHVFAVRPHRVSSAWLNTVTGSAYAQFFFLGRAKQSTNLASISSTNLMELPIVMPPPEEQGDIIEFLDRETTKINALILEQERLVELLTEKRRAVVSRAVTKGLNPIVEMRHSGVEWMREVPAHWSVLSLGRVTLEKCDGPFGSGLKSDHYTELGVRVVRLQNIRLSGFDDSSEAFIDSDYYLNELGGGHDVKQGDILIAGLGDETQTVGRACVAPAGIEPAMVKADCHRVRIDRSRAVPEFVAAQLTAGSVADAGKLSSGSTRSRIPLSDQVSRKIALPPMAEQVAIVAFLDRETSALDALVAEANEAIQLLQERRAALISAAVTGKIDVRERAVMPK